MNRLKYAFAGFAVVALANTVLIAAAPTNEAMRLTLELSDGSRVIGIPSMSSIPVQTSYAKMDIPLKRVLQVKIGADRETVWVQTESGDELTGVLNRSSTAWMIKSSWRIALAWT